MSSNTRETIKDFVGLKRIALIGVSRQKVHFSRMVLKEFVTRGYDVTLVHRQADEIEGLKCHASIADVKPPVEGALILTPAAQSYSIAEECLRAGVKSLWLYRGNRAPEGAKAIVGECPMMWLEKPEFIHALHKGFRGMIGTLPK